MIITRKRALEIVSNPAASTAIPQFHPVFEAYKQKEAEISRTKCSACRASKNLNSVGDQAIQVMISLSGDNVEKLKQLLNTKETLYVYSSDASGVKMIELGK